SYAEAIGLDGDDILREFLERYPDLQQLEAVASQVASGHPPKTHTKPRLRLTLAETPRPFAGGQVLRNISARLKAVAWDWAATLVLASVTFVVIGAFWIPLALVSLTYYVAGILILGNSPGVCLFAPKPPEDHPQSPTPHSEEALDLPTVAATI